MKRLFFYALTILIISSCRNTKSKKGSVVAKEKAGTTNNIKITEYQTKSGKKFILNVDNLTDASICDIQIETLGFTKRNNLLTLENGNIVNTFPSYNKNDANSNPTGEKRKIMYSLCWRSRLDFKAR